MVNTPERFWTLVDKRSPDECWPWKLSLSKGYGQWSYEGKNRKTHQLAWEFTHGHRPEGMQLDHVCHDPRSCAGGEGCEHRRCCNPAHLELASNAKNSAPDRAVRRNRNLDHCLRCGNRLVQGKYQRRCRECSNARSRQRRGTDEHRAYKRAYMREYRRR